MKKKYSTKNMDRDVVYKTKKRDRELVECLYGSAKEAIGELYPECEIFGFNKGQFSLIDIITHVLNQTGPATVDISTWTANKKDVSHAEKFLHNGGITRCRWVVDRSFPTRQKGYFTALCERFGVENIRMTRSHCKFCIIRNDEWNIVIRTSMNLNRNSRFENFEISDDKKMAEYFTDMVDVIFDQPDIAVLPTSKELGDWFNECEIRGEKYRYHDTSLPAMDWI